MTRSFPLLVILLLCVCGVGRADEHDVDLSSSEAVKKALSHREASVRLAATRAALTLQDRALTSPLVRRLKDDEVPIRLAALDALVAREAEKERKAAAKGIAALLKPLDREPDSAALEREALYVPPLHDLAQAISIKKLLDVHTEAPRELVQARLKAVANVPCTEAIEALIDFGSRGRRGQGRRAAVGAALQYATGQRFGNDPDKWRAWWRDAKDAFDFEAMAQSRADDRQRADDKERRREEQKRRREEKRQEKRGGERKRRDPDKPREPEEDGGDAD